MYNKIKLKVSQLKDLCEDYNDKVDNIEGEIEELIMELNTMEDEINKLKEQIDDECESIIACCKSENKPDSLIRDWENLQNELPEEVCCSVQVDIETVYFDGEVPDEGFES